MARFQEILIYLTKKSLKMAQPNAQEQYMLELINRARQNPLGEANRYGIDLNQGLSDNLISTSSKQPLAFNFDLLDAARAHSQWMLDTDTFSHIGVDNTNAGERMENAGYDFTGSWTWGENLAWKGTTGIPNVNQYIAEQHEGLFKSPGHRQNILNDSFREIGIGANLGEFSAQSLSYNSVMTTQKLAQSGSSVFLTGVAFDDLVLDDNFYTIGEGLAGIEVEAVRQSDHQVFSTTTMDAGGYQMVLAPGTYDVQFYDNNVVLGELQTITLSSTNIKLDLNTEQINPNNSRIELKADSLFAGTPEYHPSEEDGLMISNIEQTWHIQATGNQDGSSFRGQIIADSSIEELSLFKLENNDLVQLVDNSAQILEFDVSVGQNAVDGFSFNVADGVSLELELENYHDISLKAGANLEEINPFFS